MHTPLVQVSGLRKKFLVRHEQLPSVKRLITRLLRPFPTEVLWALDDINLTVVAGESVGIIGHNGSGKSTLLRMIAGIFQPTEGAVKVTGRCGGLFELAAGFTPDLSGMDNIYLSGALMGYTQPQVQARVTQVVEFSELGDFLSVPVKHYSSGMALRLGFAVAVAFEPEVLLVDEVLAVADEHFQRKAYKRLHELQNRGHAVVMVSHEMTQIKEMCGRIIWLQNGRLMQDGPAEEVIASYMASVEAENGAG